MFLRTLLEHLHLWPGHHRCRLSASLHEAVARQVAVSEIATQAAREQKHVANNAAFTSSVATIRVAASLARFLARDAQANPPPPHE